MKTLDQDFPSLSEQAVFEAIAYNPESISRASLAHLFGLKNATIQTLDIHLNTLVRSKKIRRASEDATRYEAVQPLSNIAVARLSERPTKGRAAIHVENVNFDLQMPITISEKQVRKLNLQIGERILVLLERHKGIELRAKFYERFKNNNKASLVGKFSAQSASTAANFHALDKRIKTLFGTVGKIPSHPDPRTPYYAQISIAFNPHHPEVTIGEQKWDPETGNRIYEVIASHHGIRTRHDRATASEARKAARDIHRMTPQKYDQQGRRDLSNLPIFVVDPKDARDHDDGIMVERLPYGFRTMTVVADVPLFVQSGSRLDEAARARGFSHYFPDETFHMLPLQLSTRNCSLIEGVLRPVVYVEQMRDVDGTPYKTDIGLGYIRSQRQMSYAQFQQFIQTDDPAAAPYRELQNLLIFDQYKNQILMDSASSDHRYTEAQLIVQALMIDANKAIAKFLDDQNVPYLRRAHAGHINPLAYEEIAEEFRTIGYDIPDSVYDLTPAYLNGLLGQAVMRGERDRIQSMILLRLLEPARYSTRPLPHWGLTADAYTHATSPIRRYADILTLRGVHTALGDYRHGLSQEDEANLEHIADTLNHLQIVTRNVQHDRVKYYAIKDLHRQEGNSMHATLSHVSRDEIEVFLPAYGLKKLMPTRALPSGWRCAANEQGLTDGKIYIPKGARIRVTIAHVQPHKAQWGFSRLEQVKGHYLIENERKRTRLTTAGAQAAPSAP